MSSCIVLIEDLKTGAPGISAFGGAWTGGGAGGGESGFNFTSGLGWGPCVDGLGAGVGPPKLGEAGAELIPSFMGRLEGMGPPNGGDVWELAGGTLICGLIGLNPLGESEGLVGSAII